MRGRLVRGVTTPTAERGIHIWVVGSNPASSELTG